MKTKTKFNSNSCPKCKCKLFFVRYPKESAYAYVYCSSCKRQFASYDAEWTLNYDGGYYGAYYEQEAIKV